MQRKCPKRAYFRRVNFGFFRYGNDTKSPCKGVQCNFRNEKMQNLRDENMLFSDIYVTRIYVFRAVIALLRDLPVLLVHASCGRYTFVDVCLSQT